jgi:hypothetical protein
MAIGSTRVMEILVIAFESLAPFLDSVLSLNPSQWIESSLLLRFLFPGLGLRAALKGEDS